MIESKLQKARKLEERTRKFAVQIYYLTIKLPNNPSANTLKNQLFKSSSSIGANYREANRSKSIADFKNKIRICEGEASETKYWLEIIEDLNLIEAELIYSCKTELKELLAIFTSISKKLRSVN